MSIPTTTTGSDSPIKILPFKSIKELEKGKWYRLGDRKDWLVAFAKPRLDAQKIGTFKDNQIFMFVKVVGPTESGWTTDPEGRQYRTPPNRVWVYLGFQDIFAYVSFRDTTVFQEVDDATDLSELR